MNTPSENDGLEPELTIGELKEKLRDPNYLPTTDQIDRFMKNDIEEFTEFCLDRKNPVFEFLNEEHMNALADYLTERVKEYGATKENPLMILEGGAGNGRLSHFLQIKLEERVPGLAKLKTIDSGEWRLTSDFPVEQINLDEALKKYNPDIVLFSWMPNGKDSTEEIRKCDSVREYILIGETEFVCGEAWKTWGVPDYDEDEDENEDDVEDEKEQDDNEGSDEKIPPYEADGFERIDPPDIYLLQRCRHDYYDGERKKIRLHSQTVSFKRQ